MQAGGLDRLTLDSLYDNAMASTPNQNNNMLYSPATLAPSNPFEDVATSSYQFQDPFYASSNATTPTNVQMALMAQQQQYFMMMQQQVQQQKLQNIVQNPPSPCQNPPGPYQNPPSPYQNPPSPFQNLQSPCQNPPSSCQNPPSPYQNPLTSSGNPFADKISNPPPQNLNNGLI